MLKLVNNVVLNIFGFLLLGNGLFAIINGPHTLAKIAGAATAMCGILILGRKNVKD